MTEPTTGNAPQVMEGASRETGRVSGHKDTCVAVTGTAVRQYTRNPHPAKRTPGRITITARIELCVAWCACGWVSPTVESRTRAARLERAHWYARCEGRVTA